MRALIVMAAAAAALATTGSAAVGAMAGGPMYFHIFYEDAAMTTTVGWRRDVCLNGTITAGPVNGRVSNYSEQIPTGQYCNGYNSN